MNEPEGLILTFLEESMNFMNKRASLFCSKIPKEQEIEDFLF
jgi:hypothetical protein